MKTSAIVVGSFALIAAFSRPADARVDYYDGVRANAYSGQISGRAMGGNISVGPTRGNSTAVVETVPGRPIEFARDKDGRWWPSRSLGQ